MLKDECKFDVSLKVEDREVGVARIRVIDNGPVSLDPFTAWMEFRIKESVAFACPLSRPLTEEEKERLIETVEKLWMKLQATLIDEGNRILPRRGKEFRPSKPVISVIVGFADGSWTREEILAEDAPYGPMYDDFILDVLRRRHPEPDGGAELDRYRMVFWTFDRELP